MYLPRIEEHTWYTSIPKSCPNIRFPHQQDFFPIRSVTKSSTARFSHKNLVEKFKIFVQDFVPIRTAHLLWAWDLDLEYVLDLVLFADRIIAEPKSNRSILWDMEVFNDLNGVCAFF